MRIPPTVFLALVVFVVFAGACSSTAADAAPETTTTASTTSTSEAPTTTQLDVVTTVTRVPAPELSSEGHITVGSTQYDFAFECYHAGAGDILALGVGDDPNSGDATQAIVQAFLGQT